MTIPSWLIFDLGQFVVLFVLLLAAFALVQVVGATRARAGDYAGAERWYRLAFSHQVRTAGQGNIAAAEFTAGDLEAAERRMRRVFDEARRHRYAQIELNTLVNLGACLIAQRRLGEAAPLLAWVVRSEKANALQRASVLYNLSWIAYLEFNFEEAARGLAAARLESPKPQGNLKVLYALMAARLATRTKSWDEARRHFDQAAADARRATDRGLAGQVALSRGALEYLAGNRDSGLEMVLSSAATLRAADRGDLAGRLLLGLSYIARRQGDEGAAGRLEAAGSRFRGIVPLPSAADCAAYLSPEPR